MNGDCELLNMDGNCSLTMKKIRDIISGKYCDDNANLQKNPETYHKLIADMVAKDYYLKSLPKNLRELHTEGRIHIHDLEYFGTRPFCRSWDIRPILMYGFKPDGKRGAIDAGPAKHAAVAILQATKTLAMGQTQHAGGQGLLYGLVFLSPYMEHKSYGEIKQLMQMMIYELNQMYISRGGQVIFSSINVTPGIPKILENVPIVYAGHIYDGRDKPLRTYIEFEREVRLMFQALMEISLEGDIDNKTFPFPKLEVSFEKKFVDPSTWRIPIVSKNPYGSQWEEAPSYYDLYKKCFEVVAKFGSIYFDNLLIDKKDSENSVSCTQCIPEDEIIIISRNGNVILEEAKNLQKSDMVLTSLGFSNFDDILKYEYNGNLIEIKLDGGSERIIRVTSDHEINTLNKGIVQAKDIEIGDQIQGMPCLPTNENMDHRLAYVLGSFVGNGFARETHKDSFYVEFTYNEKDLNVINRIEQYIYELMGEHGKISKALNKNAYRLKYYKKSIYDLFRNTFIGSSTKAHEKRIPSEIYCANSKAKFAFIYGYLHSNGSLIHNKHNPHRIIFSTTSNNIKIGLPLLLQSLGYNSFVSKLKNNEFSKHQRYIISINKKDDINGILGGTYKYFNNWNNWHKVSNIQTIPYIGIVIDPINVEKKHEFVVGSGYIVRNCCAYSFKSDKEIDSKFTKRLNFENGEHFKLGGMQVVSINLPHCAYESAHDDKKLIANIYDMMDRAVEIFKIKKNLIQKQLENGSLTFIGQKTPTGVSFTDFDDLVFEIGIVGLNEMLGYHCAKCYHDGQTEYFEPKEIVSTDLPIIKEDVLEFGKQIMEQMREYAKLLSEFNNMTIVLARTPAETTAQKFAVCDLLSEKHKEKAIELIKGNVKEALPKLNTTRNLPVYYSNGFAPDVSTDIHKRIQIENEFWPFVDGGAITHIWLGEDNPDPIGLMEFTLGLLQKSNIGYLAFTKDLSQCTKCNKMMSGIQTKCDRCGHEQIMIFSRITGYYSAAGIMVNGEFQRRWNASKAEELFNRSKIVLKDLIDPDIEKQIDQL